MKDHVDYQNLMAAFSRPRPDGSPGERETAAFIADWLEQHQIPHRVQTFRQYPYYFEAIGIWLMLSRALLAVGVWQRWGWVCLGIALLGLLGGTLDYAWRRPLVTWMGARQGKNILFEINPPVTQQEVLISVHYDSKTEPLDHHQRLVLLKSIPYSLGLTLAVGLLAPVDRWFYLNGSPWSDLFHWLAITLLIPLLALAWALGLNLSLGRLLTPSPGAVDDGAACAILLSLAERLGRGQPRLTRTRVTLAWFSGEEINMQGAHAYVHSRQWEKPAVAINLEAMAQDGEYVYWELDGSVFKLLPTTPQLNQALCQAVAAVTGQTPRPAGPVLSDGGIFLAAGIPTAVLGTYHSIYQDRGLHSPNDNLERVTMARLPEGVEILTRFLASLDQD